MPAMTAAGAALIRAIRAALAQSGGTVDVDGIDSRPWASATFSGEHHFLRLRVGGRDAGAAADAFLDGLDEREFGLGAHVVADIALVSRRLDGAYERLALEALTVEGA